MGKPSSFLLEISGDDPFLADKANLTVITNALNIAYRLTQYEHIPTVVLGGVMRARELDLLGHITESSLSERGNTPVPRRLRHTPAPRISWFGYFAHSHRPTHDSMTQVIIVADHTRYAR